MKQTLFLTFTLLMVLTVGSAPAKADLLKNLQDTLNKTVSPSDDPSGKTSELGVSEITEGLKEALKVGTQTVVDQIGAPGGYENDPKIHIPLPKKMQEAQSFLKQVGLSDMADEVERKLNEGAEAAAPKTKELIWKAISDMSLEDAKKIYEGPDDAATRYFRKVTTPELKKTIRPIIDKSLKDVGAIDAYDALVSDYKKYPLVPDIQSNLSKHATRRALKGFFHYLAVEEAAIRKDPVKRTTEILQSVFGR